MHYECGHTIKEYAVRLAPATQAAVGPEGSAPPATLVPPQYGAYFCSSSVLDPLKRYGINPKTRSRDGFAVKLQPLASCDQPAIADILANSTLLWRVCCLLSLKWNDSLNYFWLHCATLVLSVLEERISLGWIGSTLWSLLTMFFYFGCCIAERVVVRAVALLSAETK